VLSPEQTEGPFYLPGEPFRSDVTEGRPGVPLRLRLRVRDATTCRRIKGATVEIWHTDAAGDYSGVNGARTTFMRGRQATNGAGRAVFTTIYPGWYPGRTTHVHVKVHVGGAVVHTGQLYFDDRTTDAVYALEPYAARGPRGATNASDFIYASGGPESMLLLRRRRGGYTARATLVVRT
jgi:protocatechuate 3,4-dioxygenase beta subunit